MSPTTQIATAIGFVVILFLAVALAMLREMRGRTLTFWQWIFWWIAFYLVRFQWRCRAPRRLKLPEDGRGVVFICNHRSSIDPFFITILPDKVIHWMVAKEFVDHKIFGFFLKRCEVIPARRGGIDNAATRTAIEIAKQGGYVGMLPEGRINQTEELLLSVRPGAVLVAMKANAWIVPVYVEGAPYNNTAWSPLLMRASSSMAVGEPIDVSEYAGKERDTAAVRELTLRCVGEIAKLAGEPDFEVEIAGRKWCAPGE